MTIIGIDPGGATTAVVTRRGSMLLAHCLVHSDDTKGLPPVPYLAAVLQAVTDALTAHPGATLALEAVTPPTGFYKGHAAPIQPGSLICVSAVAGAILSHHPGTVLVPPAGNGSRPLSTYPPELVGARETRGTGILRHARSAWDIAGHPPTRKATA